MCNCIRENETKVAEHYTKQLGVPATAEVGNVALVFGKVTVERPFLPYRVKADRPGYKSAKGKEVSMFFTFCPFCGVKLEKLD